MAVLVNIILEVAGNVGHVHKFWRKMRFNIFLSLHVWSGKWISYLFIGFTTMVIWCKIACWCPEAHKDFISPVLGVVWTLTHPSTMLSLFEIQRSRAMFRTKDHHSVVFLLFCKALWLKGTFLSVSSLCLCFVCFLFLDDADVFRK